MKKNVILIFLLSFLTISSVGITFAYFYKNYAIPNQFKTMTYDVNIDEEFYDDWGTKKVYITNNDVSNTDLVLRIKYIEIWSKTINNNVYYLSNTINGVNVVDKNWTSTFLDDFYDGLDGWYYYKKVFKPNETIQILNSISLNSIASSNSDYTDSDYKLLFSYEALDLDSGLITDIWNKNITVNNLSITWQ